MLKALVILLIYVVFFGSVSCLTLPIGKFRSFGAKTTAEMLPMSDTDPGQFLRYHSEVYILHGQLIASESDYFGAGPYECTFGRIVVHPFGAPSRVGYMPILGLLRWNGEWYLNTTQLPLLLILLIVGKKVYERFQTVDHRILTGH